MSNNILCPRCNGEHVIVNEEYTLWCQDCDEYFKESDY